MINVCDCVCVWFVDENATMKTLRTDTQFYRRVYYVCVCSVIFEASKTEELLVEINTHTHLQIYKTGGRTRIYVYTV